MHVMASQLFWYVRADNQGRATRAQPPHRAGLPLPATTPLLAAVDQLKLATPSHEGQCLTRCSQPFN